MTLFRPLLALSMAIATASLPRCQELRVALDEAPIILVGKHRGLRVLDDFVLHKVLVAERIRGEVDEHVSVLEWKKVTLHQKPAIAATHLYCLHPVDASTLGLPAGRYFRLDAHPGSHPSVTERGGKVDQDPVVRFARSLERARQSGSLVTAKRELVALALEGPAPVRLEAASLLAERAALLDALDPIELAAVVGRAAAETDDIEYKIALATVAAERRMADLLDALCLSWHEIDDERFSRAVGRFARHLHGEQATEKLLPWLQRTRDPRMRGQVLLAIGATSTESALVTLLRTRQLEPNNRAVEAALRLHGSPRAVEAADKR